MRSMRSSPGAPSRAWPPSSRPGSFRFRSARSAPVRSTQWQQDGGTPVRDEIERVHILALLPYTPVQAQGRAVRLSTDISHRLSAAHPFPFSDRCRNRFEAAQQAVPMVDRQHRPVHNGADEDHNAIGWAEYSAAPGRSQVGSAMPRHPFLRGLVEVPQNRRCRIERPLPGKVGRGRSRRRAARRNAGGDQHHTGDQNNCDAAENAFRVTHAFTVPSAVPDAARWRLYVDEGSVQDRGVEGRTGRTGAPEGCSTLGGAVLRVQACPGSSGNGGRKLTTRVPIHRRSPGMCRRCRSGH